MKKLLIAVIMGMSFNAWAVDSYTPRFNLTKPAPSSLNWAGKINGDFDIIDSSVPSLNTYNVFAGSISATYFIGNGSLLTNPAGDNLGNHIATTTIDMGNYPIINMSSMTATSGVLKVNYSIDTSTYQIRGVNALKMPFGLVSIHIGESAGLQNAGVGNVFIGDASGQSTTGGANTFLGTYTGISNTSASNSTFVGYSAGYASTGADNTFVGGLAGQSNSTGTSNAFFGYQSGVGNTWGYYNSYFGRESGRQNSTGTANTIMGFNAGYSNAGGSNNAIFGALAGQGAAGTLNYNSLFGAYAGVGMTTANNNTLLGYGAGSALTTGSSNILIGANSSAPTATTSNYLNIGGIIKGDLATSSVTVNNLQASSITIGGVTQTIGYQPVIGSSDTINPISIASLGWVGVSTMTVTFKGNRPAIGMYSLNIYNGAAARDYDIVVTINSVQVDLIHKQTNVGSTYTMPSYPIDISNTTAGVNTICISIKSSSASGTQQVLDAHSVITEY